MRGTVILAIVLLPSMAAAATECRVVEYPDHYEAICTGDPAHARGSPRPVVQAQEEAPQQALALLPQKADTGGDSAIARSSIAKRHAEIWLRTQRRR